MLPSEAKDTIISYLAAGVPTSQIAAAVGCTDAYISQLKADPDVQELLAAKAGARIAKDDAFDTKLENTEAAALARIEAGLPFANLNQAVTAFRVLNGAKRRKDVAGPQTAPGATISVTLTLPANALPRYTMNSQREIVDVGGQTMVAATPQALQNLLTKRLGVEEAVYAPVERTKATELLANMTRPSRRPVKQVGPSDFADLL